MKLARDALTRHLEGPLAAAYAVYGLEPLQVLEAQDAIRATARARGYSDRQRHDVDQHFDWQTLVEERISGSLFALPKIIELRFATARLPGRGSSDEALAVLAAWFDEPPADTLLLMAFEQAERSISWLDDRRPGLVVVEIPPLYPRELPAFLGQRLRQAGFVASADVIALLIERTEGNLLAARQEIELMRLLLPAGKVDVDQARALVADQAHYEAYRFSDALAEADLGLALRVLERLAAEDFEAPRLMYPLADLVRQLYQLARALASGVDERGACDRLRIALPRRRGLVRLARSLPRARLRAAMAQLPTLDRMAKGQLPGNVYEHIERLVMRLLEASK